ncbi:hypothetical protein [Emcibacter sp.]
MDNFPLQEVKDRFQELLGLKPVVEVVAQESAGTDDEDDDGIEMF